MTKETRGLLLTFLNELNKDKEIGQLESAIIENIENIINYANAREIEKIKKEALKIEDDFIQIKDLLKYQYFDYGISANKIEKERRLDWQPKGFSEILNA